MDNIGTEKLRDKPTMDDKGKEKTAEQPPVQDRSDKTKTSQDRQREACAPDLVEIVRGRTSS